MAAESKKRRNMSRDKGPRLRPVPDSAYAGLRSDLPTTKLPLYRDVGLAMEFYKITNSTCNPIKMVTDMILQVYDKASIPTLAYDTVFNKVSNLEALKKVRLKELVFNKTRKTANNSGKFRNKSKNGKVKVKLQDVLDKLFPAADEKNIPEIEKEFYEEQKSTHLMEIGGVDLVETENILEEMEKAEEAVKEAAEVEARRVARQQAAEKFRIKQKVMNNNDTEVINQPDPDVFEDAPKQKKIRLSKRSLSRNFQN